MRNRAAIRARLVTGEALERVAKIMTKPSRGTFNSFRKPARQVAALPRTTRGHVEVWKPRLDERVQTPNGIGTVAKISGDMYLIDLEHQIASVWERLTSIKPPK
jgi:hypothetical protein